MQVVQNQTSKLSMPADCAAAASGSGFDGRPCSGTCGRSPSAADSSARRLRSKTHC